MRTVELTRSYYPGTAPGNKNGLLDDPLKLKKVVGGKMRGRVNTIFVLGGRMHDG